MKYSNRQIKRLLRIQEFVEMSNTLARAYEDYDKKEIFIETFSDKERMYRMYCSSIYNLVKAIQDSKEFFENSKKYIIFEEMLRTKYSVTNNEYCIQNNYESTLFKIIETIRHQVNHFTKDDDDDNVLFEIYIDFKIIEKLRLIINEIFFEIFNTIDKKIIKNIVLSKPKIKYSFDKITNKMDDLKIKIDQSENRLDPKLKKDNERAYELYNQLFNSSSLYDLLMKEPDAIKSFVSAEEEMDNQIKEMVEHIEKNGTEFEKEAVKLFIDFINSSNNTSIEQINSNISELQIKLNRLKEKCECN